jgi:tryptophan-rich sensory protein
MKPLLTIRGRHLAERIQWAVDRIGLIDRATLREPRELGPELIDGGIRMGGHILGDRSATMRRQRHSANPASSGKGCQCEDSWTDEIVLAHIAAMNPPTPVAATRRRQWLALTGWLALCFSAASSAVFITPGGWYAGLNKPTWNPPTWLFGPVWSLLYVMMAVAAWLVWRRGGWRQQRAALILFLAQWFLNALWTPLFFGLHQKGLALVELMWLWLTLLATVWEFWRVSRVASVLLWPYLAWVSFASYLNFTLWQLNR